jgi:hypothetical protein
MKSIILKDLNNLNFVLEDPNTINYSHIVSSNHTDVVNFLSDTYTQIYSLFNEKLATSFQIDFDSFKTIMVCPAFDRSAIKAIKADKVVLDFKGKTDRDYLLLLIAYIPNLGIVFQNTHLSAYTSLLVAEYILNKKIDATNFVEAKKYIDFINLNKWTRPQTDNEKQSGVSNLGGVSEKLLEKAFDTLIDGTNLFKTTSQEIQSYGDFVLMCLPNNLWISVKSNFARERLLASGYTTDILGVGFFTDSKEFTSYAKVRNFQRVGFLAMYLPDIALNDTQVLNETSTYQEVVDKFKDMGREMPKNINGTNFYRPLSLIADDLKKLLSQTDITKRTTINF